MNEAGTRSSVAANDRLAWLSLQKPWVWLCVAGPGYAAIELALRLAGEESYPASTAAWWAIFVVGGWGLAHYKVLLGEALYDLASMTSLQPDGEGQEQANRYVTIRVNHLFDLRQVGTVIAIAVVTVPWLWTLRSLGPPFDRPFLNWMSYLFFVPMSVVGAWCSYAIAGTIWVVRDVASKDLSAPFSLSKQPVMGRCEAGWASAGAVTVVVWGLLFTAFWLSPYGLVDELIIWLVVLSVFPFLWFVVGAVQIHSMLVGLKGENLKRASDRVEQLAHALHPEASEATLQDLNAAMDIQTKVGEMKEWPTRLAGLPSLALSLAPLVIQVTVISFGLGDSN